jgi:hypothetical protein
MKNNTYKNIKFIYKGRKMKQTKFSCFWEGLAKSNKCALDDTNNDGNCLLNGSTKGD